MSGKEKRKQEQVRKKIVVNKDTGKYRIFLTLLLLFIISALYFFFFGKHIFLYQDNQTLFIYSGEYLRQYLSKPGGLLEYAGNFILQIYFNPLYGSLVLASVFTFTAFIFLSIVRKIYTYGSFLLTLMIIPSCILILLQADFNYQIHNNIGFLLASGYFLLVIKSKKRYLLLIWLALFPVLYILAGGFAWIFAGMYITYCLLNKNILYPVILIAFASLTLLLCKELLFLQPLSELSYYPLPQKSYFKVPALLYMVFGLFILYPAFLMALKPVKINPQNSGNISLYIVMILFSLTVFILSKIYNPEISNLFKLEHFVQQAKWEEVIKLQEKIQSGNIIAQYYYNLALSETDQLCDRMFCGRQDFGPGSLMVQWDSRVSINQIFRGAYFFYSIGLINEAHRWAFESMVMQGYRPENIKMLIRTELINGHYKIAKKYIYVLRQTLRYRNLGKKFEAMLENPELIKADPDLGKKIKLRSGEDFLIRIKDQQANVILLLQSNPLNIRAFEYKMAWFMLEKNTGKVAEEIKKMNAFGYNRIPGHIEEAALYFKSVTGIFPDLGGLTINNKTENRFLQYISAEEQIGNTSTSGKEKMQIAFGNTYWFYNDFK